MRKPGEVCLVEIVVCEGGGVAGGSSSESLIVAVGIRGIGASKAKGFGVAIWGLVDEVGRYWSRAGCLGVTKSW